MKVSTLSFVDILAEFTQSLTNQLSELDQHNAFCQGGNLMIGDSDLSYSVTLTIAGTRVHYWNWSPLSFDPTGNAVKNFSAGIDAEEVPLVTVFCHQYLRTSIDRSFRKSTWWPRLPPAAPKCFTALPSVSNIRFSSVLMKASKMIYCARGPAVTLSNRQFPIIAGYVHGLNSDRAEYRSLVCELGKHKATT